LYLVLLRNLLDSYSKFQVLIVMKRVVLYSERTTSLCLYLELETFGQVKGKQGR